MQNALSVFVAKLFASTLVCAILLVIVVPVYMSMRADGRVTYCYVDAEKQTVKNRRDVVTYTLKGYRPWRFDRELAHSLDSLEEARNLASTYGCELK